MKPQGSLVPALLPIAQRRTRMPSTGESSNGDQRIASLIRGAAPKSVSVTPQSMKPAAR
jgi:hypothetical protein